MTDQTAARLPGFTHLPARLLATIRGRPMVRNTLLQMLNQMFGIGTSVVTFAMISRTLGSAGYGQYGLALTYAAFVGIFLDAGLDTYVVTELARAGGYPASDGSARRLVSEATLVRILIGMLATGAAIGLAVAVGYPVEVVAGIAILSGTTLLGAVAALLGDVFQAVLDVRLAVAAAFLSRVLTAMLIVALFVARSLTIWTLFSVTVVGAVASVVLAIAVAYWKGFRFTLPSLARGVHLYQATAPLAAWVLLGQIVHRADAIILSLVSLSPSLHLTNEETVGIYIAAYKFFDLSNALPGYVVVTLMPRLASMARDRDAFDTYLGRWIPRMAGMGAVVAVGLAVVGGPALLLLSGPAFGPSAPILAILSIAIGLAFETSLLFAAIIALGRRQTVVALYLVVAVANVIGNFALDPQWAYWGAAWLTVVSQAILCLGMLWILRDAVRWKS